VTSAEWVLIDLVVV